MAAVAYRRGEASLFALTLALSGALAALRARDAVLSRSLDVRTGSDDVIDLPDLGEPAPQQLDTATLAPLGPLYLAYQLDAAGLLRTGELVASLFASGAITMPLNPAVARTLHEFWQGRNERLTEQERAHLFAQVFDPATFDPRMERLCKALVALADNAGFEDIRENVGLEQAGLTLAEAVWPSISGMVAFAARDVIEAINAATRFLGERGLQAAFGVGDLWALVATTNRAQGIGAQAAREHVERGRNGMIVLRWLAESAPHGARLDRSDPQADNVIAASEHWLLARPSTGTA